MVTSPFWMLIYAITDRRLRPGLDPVALAASLARSGADMIQIREKDLTAAEMLPLVRAAVGAGGAAVMVNGRPDVALAAGAAGVHLPASGLPPGAVHAVWGGRLRIGRSTHSVEEAIAAEADGADLITFGPVFATASKLRYGPPVGVAALARAVAAVSIPVFAIGGIDERSVRRLRDVPVAGVAVISAILGADDMTGAVVALRAAAAGRGHTSSG